MTIIILGAGGMLGHALMEAFPGAHGCEREVDITLPRSVDRAFIRHQPRVVINAAAYTNVDACEHNRDLAFATNALALEHIAKCCARDGATLVHYSTDYVFDGKRSPYLEHSRPNPLNVYGASKLLGEQIIQENMDDYRIIRTSWLFGPHGRNFVDTVRTLGSTRQVVPVVNDQYGCPTYTRDLAQATAAIIGLEPGIYHLTNKGICSWYEFALDIIPNAQPCSSENLHRDARRPKYSVLVNTRAPPLRHWKPALAEYLNGGAKA